MISPEELMQLAIDKCRQGIAAGNSPFGCAIARGDRVLAVAHNLVLATIDITAHAEVVAIRAACHETDSIFLEGAIVATTCEPCPMCAAALHWARVDTTYYGAMIEDATAVGFNELHMPADKLLALGGSSMKLVPGFLRDPCRQLFDEWKRTPGARCY
jgi:guanine deaminase